jgi:tyrosine-protein phosphatase YwqE
MVIAPPENYRAVRRYIITIEGPSFEDVDKVELPAPPDPGEPIETNLGTCIVTGTEQSMLVQVTAASLDGRLGRRSRTAADELIEHDLAHLVASDAHAPDVRAIGMKSAAQAIADSALATWLTVAAPRAVVAGAPLPKRPATHKRGRLFGR